MPSLLDLIKDPKNTVYPIEVEVNGSYYDIVVYEEVQCPNGGIFSMRFKTRDGGTLWAKMDRNRITRVQRYDLRGMSILEGIIGYQLPVTLLDRSNDRGVLINILQESDVLGTYTTEEVSTGNRSSVSMHSLGYDIVFPYLPSLTSAKSMKKPPICTCGGVSTYGNTMDCSPWCDLRDRK